jgi:hypothetical protein
MAIEKPFWYCVDRFSEIVGEAEHSREFVPGLQIEIGVAAAVDRRSYPRAKLSASRDLQKVA